MRALRTLLPSLAAVALLAGTARADDAPAASAPPSAVLRVAPSPELRVAPSHTTLSPPLRTTLSPLVPASLDLAVPRGDVASLGPVGRLPTFPRWGWGAYDSKPPMRTTGWVLFGLGLATLFGAGVTAIVAATSASDLGEDCPGFVCVEGTDGARDYHRAVDASRGADWLIGIGMPVVSSGLVLLIYSAVLERNAKLVMPTPVFHAGPNGASMTMNF